MLEKNVLASLRCLHSKYLDYFPSSKINSQKLFRQKLVAEPLLANHASADCPAHLTSGKPSNSKGLRLVGKHFPY